MCEALQREIDHRAMSEIGPNNEAGAKPQGQSWAGAQTTAV